MNLGLNVIQQLIQAFGMHQQRWALMILTIPILVCADLLRS